MNELEAFRKPSAIERIFNKVFGAMAGLGIGLSHNYLLIVIGRKTGREYRTPVNLLRMDGKDYLVAPRGETAWVRNVRVAGELRLKRGADDASYLAHEVPEYDRVPILREYLTRFLTTVQRYFLVDPASSEDEYREIVEMHPVFLLEKKTGSA